MPPFNVPFNAKSDFPFFTFNVKGILGQKVVAAAGQLRKDYRGRSWATGVEEPAKTLRCAPNIVCEKFGSKLTRSRADAAVPWRSGCTQDFR